MHIFRFDFLIIFVIFCSLMNFYDNQRIHNLAVGLSRASKKYFEHSSLQIRKRIAIEAALLTTKLKDIMRINSRREKKKEGEFCSLTPLRDGSYVPTHFSSVEIAQGGIVVSF
jgi:hypothetical protein